MSLVALEAAVTNLIAAPDDVEVATDVYTETLDASQKDLDTLSARFAEAPAAAAVWKWNNLVMDHAPALVAKPKSVAEILDVLVASKRAKAIGNGWGFSMAGQTEGALIPMVTMPNEALTVDADVLTSEAAKRMGLLYRFSAGTTIRTLNRRLSERGLALWNAPGFDELTFAGVMSSGGHGSGVWLGPLAEQVQSLGLVTLGSGRARRTLIVERKEGITDRAALERKYGNAVELFTSDALFQACVVGIGALGVITDVTIDVRPAFMLEESRTFMDWEDAVAQLPDLLRDQGPEKTYHSIELWLNPYPTLGHVRCILGTKKWTDRAKHGQRGFGVRKASAKAFAFLSRLMKAHPSTIPALLHAGLLLTRGTDVVMPSTEALDFGPPNSAAVDPAAVAVPLDDLPSVLSTLIGFLQARRRDEKASVTSPVGLRFVGLSNAWLAPQYRRPSCVIEMPLLEGTPMAFETLKAFHEWARSHKGRPHWGQLHWVTSAQLKEAYPEENIRAFKGAFKDLDGESVFDNDFTDGLWLAEGPPFDAFASAKDPYAAARRKTFASWSRLFNDLSAPNTVALPGGGQNIIALLKHAKANGLKLVLRAGGNALHTQALGEAAVPHVYLETEAGGAIDFHQDAQGGWTVTVAAGVQWDALIAATLERGFVPRVVVTTPFATVGGTLASNSIGQASRRYGHEGDGVVSIKVAVPLGAAVDPTIKEIPRPAPGAAGPDAELFRAVIGGYGVVGILVEATYELVRVPSNARAVTRVHAFDAEHDMESALAALENAPADDGLFKSCTLFLSRKGWRAGVVSTSFEEHDDSGSHMLPYSGKTHLRRISELMLAFMPTAFLAHEIAAGVIEKASQNGTVHVDPVRGFLFLMEPNHDFKRRHSDFIAATVQQTFVLPNRSAARQFIEEVFVRLRQRVDVTPPDDGELDGLITEDPELFATLADIERTALDVEGRDTAVAEPDVALARAAIGRLSKRPHILPALFEMIWVPEDDHILSATHKRSGFAVSLTFQGPGVASVGFLARLFKRRHDAIFAALRGLSTKCEKLGGRIHLTKNVFVEGDERDYVKRMLGNRRDRFNNVRKDNDPLGILTSRFSTALLDAPPPPPPPPVLNAAPRTPEPSDARTVPAEQSPPRASKPRRAPRRR